MPTPQLESYFSDVLSQLREQSEDHFLFTTETLLAAPPELECKHLAIVIGSHTYNYFHCDTLNFFGAQDAYLHLGLLTLSILLNDNPSTCVLHLLHPHSEIKKLVIQSARTKLEDGIPGFCMKPIGFNYYPSSVGVHPFSSSNPPQPENLPTFEILNLQRGPLPKSDTVRGFGSVEATGLLAELFLNFGNMNNFLLEIALEAEPGFRGVGIASAEAKFWLPGSAAWDKKFNV